MRPRRFRTQLLLVLLGLLALVQGLTVLVVGISIRRATLRTVRENLVAGVDQLDRQLADRMGELADKARLLVGDYSLRQTLLHTDEPETLRSAFVTYARRMGAGDARVSLAHLVLLDLEGRIVASMHPRALDEQQTVFRDLWRRAEASDSLEHEARGLALLDRTLHGVLLVPVLAPEVVAWMGFAFPVDGGFARQLKQAARLDLSFFATGPSRALLASTLPPEQAKSLTAVVAAELERSSSAGNGEVRELAIGDDTAATLVRRLPLLDRSSIVAVFQRSLAVELAPLRRLLRVLLIAGAVVLVLAAGITLRLARAVSAPVRQLARHTRVIAAGDYAKTIRVRGAEEMNELAEALNRMSAGLAERDRVRDLLDKNISPEIASRLLRDGVTLGGDEREVTILFADLRGFTTLCETLTPREVVTLLNRYFTRMSVAIEGEGGVIDKYIGDAIMALFGAPVDAPDAADRALRAALGMRHELAALNQSLALEGRPPLEFGVGVNTATVVAGRIGSERRMNYSVIGDGVNVAARLQALTRAENYRADIIVSSATLERVSRGYVARSLGEVSVKGRIGRIAVHALEAETS